MSLPRCLRTPLSWFLRPSTTVWMAVIGALVVERFSRYPLWPTDLWDHVNYGRFILQSGTIPTTEPLLSVADGMHFVATAWLSQVLMAIFADTAWLGLEGLQLGYALLIAVAVASVVAAVFRTHPRYFAAAVAGGAFLAVNWEQLKVIRPQLIGVSCFAWLWLQLTPGRLSRPRFWSTLILFLIWANCHGSFALGLTLIGLDIAGRSLDLWWRTGRLGDVGRSAELRRRWTLLAGCTLAACVNPFGPEIFREVLRVGRHPNITSMYEWAPLSLSMRQGRATAVVIGLWGLCLLYSPARRRAREVLPVVFFAVLSVWSARMVNWLAPVVAVSLGRHLAALHGQVFIGRRWSSFLQQRWPAAVPLFWRSGRRWLLLNLLVLSLLFAQTNLGRRTVWRQQLSSSQTLASFTPLQITQFLANSDLPDGSALIPAEWAGFVMYSLDGQLQSFVNLHVHVIPETVWQEYLQLLRGPADLGERLHRLGIDLVVVDAMRQRKLRRRMSETVDFCVVYEDLQGIVFRRQTPRSAPEALSPQLSRPSRDPEP